MLYLAIGLRVGVSFDIIANFSALCRDGIHQLDEVYDNMCATSSIRDVSINGLAGQREDAEGGT